MNYCQICRIDVYGSHYHCNDCGKLISMMGHSKGELCWKTDWRAAVREGRFVVR